MPAQTTSDTGIAYFKENDTWPALIVTLIDRDGKGIDLTGATVTIDIAHARYDYYYSPGTKIVTAGVCTPDPDQVTNPGKVSWVPGDGDLSPPGSYLAEFVITPPAGGQQTVPANTYYPIIIRARAGGA